MNRERQNKAISAICKWDPPRKATKSLSVMRDAEKCLALDQKERYLEIIMEGVVARHPLDMFWGIVHATPEVKAEAFLKTHNAWED